MFSSLMLEDMNPDDVRELLVPTNREGGERPKKVQPEVSVD